MFSKLSISVDDCRNVFVVDQPKTVKVTQVQASAGPPGGVPSGLCLCSSSPLPPTPPAEKATEPGQQARHSRASNWPWNGREPTASRCEPKNVVRLGYKQRISKRVDRNKITARAPGGDECLCQRYRVDLPHLAEVRIDKELTEEISGGPYRGPVGTRNGSQIPQECSGVCIIS